MNRLTLVLPDGLLVKLVRRLEGVACQKQVQVKSVFRVRAEIDAVEEGGGSAAVMQRRNFRLVEEAAGTIEVEGDEVAQPGTAIADRCTLANRPERSIGRIETTGRFLLIQSRFGNRVHDQAGLVAVLSGRCAGDYFQRLNRI